MNNAYYTLELREHKGLSSWACTPTRSPGAYLVGMCPQTVLDQELLRHPDTLFVLHNSVKAHNLPDSLHPLSLLCFWFEILTLYLICWTPCWTPYLLYHLLKLPFFSYFSSLHWWHQWPLQGLRKLRLCNPGPQASDRFHKFVQWERQKCLQKQQNSVVVSGGRSFWAPGDKIGLVSSAALQLRKRRLHSGICNFAPFFWADRADMPVREILKIPLDRSTAQSLPLTWAPGPPCRAVWRGPCSLAPLQHACSSWLCLRTSVGYI